MNDRASQVAPMITSRLGAGSSDGQVLRDVKGGERDRAMRNESIQKSCVSYAGEWYVVSVALNGVDGNTEYLSMATAMEE